MNDGTNHFESEVLTETMQREVALAVIIPAFNAEKYLEQCVRSVITQPCKDLLIVLSYLQQDMNVQMHILN